MHCHECGQDIRTDKAFCSSCGAKIRQVAHNETTDQTGTPVVAAKNSEASLSLEYGPLKWDNIIVFVVTAVLLIALLVNFLSESNDGHSLKSGDYVQSSMVEKYLNGKTEKFYKQNGYTWIDTSNYKGWEKDGKYNGYGIYTWENGEYKGEWKNGNIHGYGIYTSEDGIQYKGQWKNDKKHGQGSLILADGERYKGEWKNDMRHGYGVNIWADGNHYEGEWKNGNMHGQGIYTFKNGNSEEGRFEDNELKYGAKRVISN